MSSESPAANGPVPRNPPKQRTGLVTLLFTDMVDSTALKQRLGDTTAAQLFREHHALVRDLLTRFPGAEEIETAGDSFLLVFATPSDAVWFALTAQTRLRRLAQQPAGMELDRIGIHVGEVVVGAEVAARPKDLFGIQIDTCARIMSLAKAGQILMSRPVFDSARQVLKGGDMPEVGALEWLNHGPYAMKGLGEPVEICEVREQSSRSLGPPLSSEKAQRQLSREAENVPAWRPAIGQPVPGTRWLLETKLGEGGFGEVWLGTHQHTRERRVFKFCFQPERVRFLKREITLFRLLKDRLGDHPNIVRLHDVQLDQPPYYVEMDYVSGADLRTWCEGQGGISAVTLGQRLEIVALAAEALQGAHEAGVVHRDIKPANILIGAVKSSNPPKIEVKLSDFGIGQVVSEEYLKGITRAGFTQTLLSSSSSSQSGTRLYMAPEVLAGKPASLRSDIYSLGIVLFQLLVEDFSRPLTSDWADDITDPLLREDLQHCVAGKPHDRFDSAAQLARNLRALPDRRSELERRQAEAQDRERAAYRRGVLRSAFVATLVAVVIGGLALVALRQSGQLRRAAQELRRSLYLAEIRVAQTDLQEGDYRHATQLIKKYQSVAPATEDLRGFEWRHLWYSSQDYSRISLTAHRDRVTSVSFSADGSILATASKDATVKLWRFPDMQEIRTIQTPAWVEYAALSPDGKLLALSNFPDGPAQIWDAQIGAQKFVLEEAGHQTRFRRFSADGRFVLTANSAGHVQLWDALSGHLVHTLDTPRGEHTWYELTPDNRQVIYSSGDGPVTVWDVTSEQLTETLRACRSKRGMALSPDGQLLATNPNENTGEVWNLLERRLVDSFPTHGWPSWAFSKDGKLLAYAGGDNRVRLRSIADHIETVALAGHKSRALDLAFSPDGKVLVTGGMDAVVKVWDTSPPAPPWVIAGHYANPNMSTITFSPDGRLFAFPGTNHTVEVYRTNPWRLHASLKGHQANTLGLAFGPDSNLLASSDVQGTIRVWDIAAGRTTRVLVTNAGWIPALAISPDGKLLAASAGEPNSRLKLWDLQTGQEIAAIDGHKDCIMSLAFSPSARMLATSSGDSTVKLWDMTAKHELATLTDHTDWGNVVAFAPSGKWLASSSDDGTVIAWDVATRRILAHLSVSGDMCGTLAISPDGRTLATGSADSRIRLWDTFTWENTLTLSGHRGPVMSLAFSPDGQTLASGSMDETVRLWHAPSLQQIDSAAGNHVRTGH